MACIVFGKKVDRGNVTDVAMLCWSHIFSVSSSNTFVNARINTKEGRNETRKASKSTARIPLRPTPHTLRRRSSTIFPAEFILMAFLQSYVCIVLILGFVHWTTAFPSIRQAYKYPVSCGEEKPLAMQVTEEHIEALNDCNINRLVQLRTEDFKMYLPRGEVVDGKENAAIAFTNWCKPYPKGIRGFELVIQDAFLVGNTYNVRWVLRSPFFEDYPGADAYVTRGFKMAAIVTTLDVNALNFTKEL